ncbi:hypothetical protein J6590_014142 [Homalodisca vitripennis]|nr:hypothetical protein J6590_014142 [Homalodisca vitripennis]
MYPLLAPCSFNLRIGGSRGDGKKFRLKHSSMGPLTVLFFASYIIGSLTVIGLLLEANSHAVMFEVTRCTALVLLLHQCAGALRDPIIAPALLQLFYITSASFWALRCLTGLKQIPHSQ